MKFKRLIDLTRSVTKDVNDGDQKLNSDEPQNQDKAYQQRKKIHISYKTMEHILLLGIIKYLRISLLTL